MTIKPTSCKCGPTTKIRTIIILVNSEAFSYLSYFQQITPERLRIQSLETKNL